MAYQFEFIRDTRSSDKPLKQIDIDHKKLLKAVRNLPVKLSFGTIGQYSFDQGKIISFRRTYIIEKSTRKITWENVFGIINAIYTPVYDRC